MESEQRLAELLKNTPATCWACGGRIAADDNYCRKCGKGQGRSVDWYYKHWGILILIPAAGPFVLPLVWRSPALSRSAKWAYTGVVSLFTWYLASALYRFWTLLNSALNAGMGSSY